MAGNLEYNWRDMVVLMIPHAVVAAVHVEEGRVLAVVHAIVDPNRVLARVVVAVIVTATVMRSVEAVAMMTAAVKRRVDPGLAVAVQVVIAAVIVAEIAVATVAGIVAETVVAIAVVIEVVRVAKALEMKGATGHRRQKKKLLEMLTEIETKKTMDMTIAVAVTVTRMTKMTDDQLRARDLVRDPIRVQDHDLGLRIEKFYRAPFMDLERGLKIF